MPKHKFNINLFRFPKNNPDACFYLNFVNPSEFFHHGNRFLSQTTTMFSNIGQKTSQTEYFPQRIEYIFLKFPFVYNPFLF